MNATGSRDLKIWLADGTNYPGQDDMRARQDRLADSLREDLRAHRRDQRLVLEYKFFEPAFYHTDVPDWGTRYAQVRRARRPRRGLSRHRPSRAWHEHRVHRRAAAAARKLGSFDFNSRFYADDDLIVGAADPFQLFRILFEVIRGGGYGDDPQVAFMLDQCHNIEDKIPGQIRSVLNVQEMTARALLVDRDGACRRRRRGRRAAANEILMDAFYTDVRPALADGASRAGCRRPDGAYAASGYRRKIAKERVGGAQAGWGA